MHCVVLSPSGMITLSIDCPSRVTSRSLRVPSCEVWISATSRPPITAVSASRARVSRPRLVMSSKLRAPLSWTQRQICSPRNRGQPWATANASASSSVLARRSSLPAWSTPLTTTGGRRGLLDGDGELGRECVGELEALDRRLDDLADAGVGRGVRAGGERARRVDLDAEAARLVLVLRRDERRL